jgi:sugar lactone lactonase YvrE
MGVRGTVAAAGALSLLAACSLLLPFGDLDSASTDGGAGATMPEDGSLGDALQADATFSGASRPEASLSDNVLPEASNPNDARVEIDAGTIEASTPPLCTPTSVLTDPNNCGTCGHVCCGVACFDGGCLPGVARTLESASTDPYAIALDPDGTAVYWSHVTGDGGSAIVRFDKATLATTEIARGLGEVNAIAVGPDDVYISDPGNGTMARVPKNGGAVVPIDTGEIQPRGITLDSMHVWWTEAGYGSSGSDNGAIHRAGLDAGNPQVLYSGRTGPDGIALSGNTLLWTEFESDDVAIGATIGGSGPTTTLSGETRAHAIVTDGTDVYFTDYSIATVRHLVLGGSPETFETAPSYTSTDGIAIDANTVYWVARSASGSLWASPRNGQPRTGLAQNLLCPKQVVVDGACVYWTEEGVCQYPADSAPNAGTGRVMRIDKPR